MISNNVKKVLAALAISATFASAAMAQTDAGGPGSGGSLGGSVAPLGLPGGGGGAAPSGGTSGSGLSGSGASGLAGARASFLNAAAGGATVSNPAGGTATVPQNAARALGAVLGGNSTTTQMTTLSSALTGVPAASATALGNALAAFGRGASFTTLSAAVAAYNAALNAMPAGAAPSPTLLAVRSALAAASRQ